VSASSDFQLRRNAFGRLVCVDDQGIEHEGVVPVRAFPITEPDGGIALVDGSGKEVGWIDNIESLAGESRALVISELASREFMPCIQRICRVSSFATPSAWLVETDRGETSFVLRGEEDIRRLMGSTLLIADSHGIQFLIRDLHALDRASRKLLDRFL
jgi:hypothetical protein